MGQKVVLLKVRQIRNDFFKPTFLSKNERTNSTLQLVFVRFLEEIEDTKKDISKLTDL